MIKLIMFDLDDTLVNHKMGASTALNSFIELIIHLHYTGKNYDFRPFCDSYCKRNHQLWDDFVKGRVTINELFHKIFQYIFYWFDIKEKHRDLIESICWSSYVNNCPLTSGWGPVLEELSKKLTLVVCSNGASKVQLRKLEANNLTQFFKWFYFWATHPDCKPNKNFFITS